MAPLPSAGPDTDAHPVLTRGGETNAWAALALGVIREPGGSAATVHPTNAVDGETGAARDAVRQLIYRQVAWANALRIQLRQQAGPHRRDSDDFLHIATVRRLQAEQGDDEHMDALVERFSCHLGEGQQGRPGNVASALLRQQADQIAHWLSMLVDRPSNRHKDRPASAESRPSPTAGAHRHRRPRRHITGLPWRSPWPVWCVSRAR